VVLQKKIVSLLSLPLFFSIPIPGDKNHYFPWVHVDDIAGFTSYSIENNLEGVFNLVSPNFTTHQEFFKTIISHKKGLLKWVLFLPKVIVKFLLGDMSEMLLYGPKTEPQRTLESGYKFKFQSLKDALSNLS
jgi:NAD dependent epimerase/dehydratase family enzyme